MDKVIRSLNNWGQEAKTNTCLLIEELEPSDNGFTVRLREWVGGVGGGGGVN